MQVLDFIILLHYYIITLKNTSNPQMSFCFYEVNFVRGVARIVILKIQSKKKGIYGKRDMGCTKNT
jgi:hypothetical protein